MDKELKKIIKRRQFNKSMQIAFAYVGVLTGAGLASGQELMQYFIRFGISGIIGVLIVGILHMIFGRIILSLGSYFLASDHSEVLDKITHPWIVKFLDLGLILTCFILGFVMIAGAGSNLNQQFGIPVWVGALICSLMILLISQFDFNKVSSIIGAFTPLIVGFIFLGTIYTFLFTNVNLKEATDIAINQPTSLPNVFVSTVNYFSMCIITGCSMAFVLGGEEFNQKIASNGGRIGGAITGIITFISAITLYTQIKMVQGSDLPMQLLINNIHPILGTLMSLIIYGMIFNTGISLYYSLARRVGGEKRTKFNISLLILVSIGFMLSFLGFKKLVGLMYPIIGYIGLILIIVMFYWWFVERKNLKKEKIRRQKILRLILAREDENQEFTEDQSIKLKTMIENSHINNKDIRQNALERVEEHLSSRDE